MTNLDSTLQKVRLMETDQGRLLLEVAQTLDQFKQELRAFYAKKKINVSDKVLDYLLLIYGIDAPKTPEAVARVRNIMKNPKRFIDSLKQLSGDTTQEMTQKVNQEGNPTNDPAIAKALLKLFQDIEKNTSMTASVSQTISADIMELVRSGQAEQKVGQYFDKEAKLNPKMARLLVMAKQFFESQIKAAKEGKKSPLCGTDHTGDAVLVIETGKGGTIIIDSDDPALTDEELTQYNLTVDAVRGKECTAWVRLDEGGDELVEVKKAGLAPDDLKQIGAFITNAPNEIKPLFDLPTVFFSNTDEKVRRDVIGAASKADLNQKKAQDIAQKWGYDTNLNTGYDAHSGSLIMPVSQSDLQAPQGKMFEWLATNLKSANIVLGKNTISINGNFRNGVFTNSALRIHFSNYKQPNLATLSSVDILGADTNTIKSAAKQWGLRIQQLNDIGGGVRIIYRGK
jgi:hypothetical protein